MPLAQVMLLEAGRMKEFDSPRSDGCFFFRGQAVVAVVEAKQNF